MARQVKKLQKHTPKWCQKLSNVASGFLEKEAKGHTFQFINKIFSKEAQNSHRQACASCVVAALHRLYNRMDGFEPNIRMLQDSTENTSVGKRRRRNAPKTRHDSPKHGSRTRKHHAREGQISHKAAPKNCLMCVWNLERKTPRQWKTEKHQNCAQKVTNCNWVLAAGCWLLPAGCCCCCCWCSSCRCCPCCRCCDRCCC